MKKLVNQIPARHFPMLFLRSSIAVLLLGSVAFVETQTVRDTRSGVDIVFRADQSIFPASWRRSPINAQAEQIDPSEVERTRRAVEVAMAKYPAQLLAENLKAVYVTKSIRFYGLAYGATNSADAIYISNSGRRNGYTDLVLEGSFHHEFSSILLRKNPAKLPETRWNALNPDDFQYLGTGTDALREGVASTRYDAQLARRGFYSQYSMASIEEDFNILAEMLFLGDEDLWKGSEEFPALRAKLQMVIDFYHALSPVYTESFFKAQSR